MNCQFYGNSTGVRLVSDNKFIIIRTRFCSRGFRHSISLLPDLNDSEKQHLYNIVQIVVLIYAKEFKSADQYLETKNATIN